MRISELIEKLKLVVSLEEKDPEIIVQVYNGLGWEDGYEFNITTSLVKQTNKNGLFILLMVRKLEDPVWYPSIGFAFNDGNFENINEVIHLDFTP